MSRPPRDACSDDKAPAEEEARAAGRRDEDERMRPAERERIERPGKERGADEKEGCGAREML